MSTVARRAESHGPIVIAIGAIRPLRPPSLNGSGDVHSQGLAWKSAALVFVKSPSHFRQSFADRGAHPRRQYTWGRLRRHALHPVTKVTRPLYPSIRI
jgi:hypothetical protein